MREPPEPGADRLRLDKWLWHARFFKSRSLAAAQCRAKKIRINGSHCSKASVMVAIGDVLTFPKAGDIKVVEVVALGVRRGPASEAVTLYRDLTPAPATVENTPKDPRQNPAREKGMGRPTKSDRRALDRLMHKR